MNKNETSNVNEQKAIELMGEVEAYRKTIGNCKDALASAEQELDEALERYYDQLNK